MEYFDTVNSLIKDSTVLSIFTFICLFQIVSGLINKKFIEKYLMGHYATAIENVLKGMTNESNLDKISNKSNSEFNLTNLDYVFHKFFDHNYSDNSFQESKFIYIFVIK